MKKKLHDVDVTNKKVLLRVDYNVPLVKDSKNSWAYLVQDNTRILATTKTIKYLVSKQAKIIIFSHLGRVKSPQDLTSKSLAPVAQKLEEILKQKVRFIPHTQGKVLENAILEMKPGEIIMLENTRFEDLEGKKESKNDPHLAKYWASLGDVFVNDSFGTSHRAHASNLGIATYIKESCFGFLVEKELKMLNQALKNPKRPLVAIIGGAKVSDKIGVINQMIDKADKIIIGGAMSYTFLKALGYETGLSMLEKDKITLAKLILEKAKNKIILPIDSATSPKFDNLQPTYTSDQNIALDHMGLDIGPQSIALFKMAIQNAQTIIWNGPMGVFEFSHFAQGTKAVCEAIANLKNTFTIIGGGDSAAAAVSLGYKNKFSHVSTGGGATLAYMENQNLVSFTPIKDK